MWQTMGIVAKGVAVVLFIMSMWSFGVAFERIFTFTQARNQSKLFAPQVAKQLKDGRLKEAIALASSKNYRYSHLAKVVLAGLQEYQFQQESGTGMDRSDVIDTVRRAIQRAAALTASDLKKGVSALATIGSTAPFVGLLGTVIGVINAFQGIGASGSAGIGAVSIGISEALVETALGLVVAIPAVWFYNYLTGRVEYFNVEMDNSSSELVDFFIRKTT
jgi:biopolymer transport protein ExbB/biopolymer transport protein TolQ